MATYVEGRGLATEAEPLGLLSEGATGIAAIVLAVIALAGISAPIFAAIITIVIGVGLMVQAFNSAAESSKAAPAGLAASGPTSEVGGEVMVDCLTGITGIVLGVLALVGINAPHLDPGRADRFRRRAAAGRGHPDAAQDRPGRRHRHGSGAGRFSSRFGRSRRNGSHGRDRRDRARHPVLDLHVVHGSWFWSALSRSAPRC